MTSKAAFLETFGIYILVSLMTIFLFALSFGLVFVFCQGIALTCKTGNPAWVLLSAGAIIFACAVFAFFNSRESEQ